MPKKTTIKKYLPNSKEKYMCAKHKKFFTDELLNWKKDIIKAYRQLAKVYHPDKGGNEDDFNFILDAYQTLKDPVKKRSYDRGY